MCQRIARMIANQPRGSGVQGVGLIEVMLALLIFATAMSGLVLTQLSGKKAVGEALQRSQASLLAQDLLERMRGNPGELAIYAAAVLGDASRALALPAVDCTVNNCGPMQLARYDLWQWELLLLGASELEGIYRLGGLVSPRACISVVGNRFSLTLNWRGPEARAVAVDPACVAAGEGLYDAADKPPGNNLRRRALTVSTALDGSLL